MNFVFTTLTHFDPVDSQLELYRQGYTIYTSPGVKTLIEPPVNEVQDLLLKNRLITSNEDDGFQSVLRNKKAATLRRKSDFVLESRMSYLDEDSEFLFRVVEESFRCQYLSYISTDGKYVRIAFFMPTMNLMTLDWPGCAGHWASMYKVPTAVDSSIGEAPIVWKWASYIYDNRRVRRRSVMMKNINYYLSLCPVY